MILVVVTFYCFRLLPCHELVEKKAKPRILHYCSPLNWGKNKGRAFTGTAKSCGRGRLMEVMGFIYNKYLLILQDFIDKGSTVVGKKSHRMQRGRVPGVRRCSCNPDKSWVKPYTLPLAGFVLGLPPASYDFY